MLCACAVLQVGAAQEPGSAAATAQGPAAGSEAAQRLLVRGQLRSDYRLRWTGDGGDQDLYETLSLDIGDADQHAVSGHLLARFAGDLDGRTAQPSPFLSIDDKYGGAYVRLYDAYADLHSVPGMALVRLGRQTARDTPELAWFDGVMAETSPVGPGEVKFGVYGGSSAHLYEGSAHGDWTLGLYAEGRPWSDARARLDWMHLEDEALLGAHNDDLLAAGFWQTICRKVEVETQYTRVEGRDRDVRARAAFRDPETEFTAQLDYYRLLRTQRSLVVELDPFFSALHEEFPYWQGGVRLGKALWQHLDLRAGTDFRRVADRADVGTFNRDYERSYFTVSEHDLLVQGLTVSGTADIWHSNAQDVHTWGADADQKLGDDLTVSVGTYYSLYKFDLFLDAERDHVRTWFAKLRHKASKAATLDLSYELEQSSVDEFHMLRMGLTWRF